MMQLNLRKGQKMFWFLALGLMFSQCSPKEQSIIVRNNTDGNQKQQAVEVALDQLHLPLQENIKSLQLVNAKGEAVRHQLLDTNNDGQLDKLLFQASLAARSTQTFKLTSIGHTENADSSVSQVYSRFVPERTDDYTWENDRVAFRTYGPEAQRMVEENIPGGTLSSGMDCWLKKVDYPIINKWYEKHTSGSGSYHEDTGEGLDNFHVGASRGCGGIGVYVNDELYVSRNFTAYQRSSNGPIRTSFILDYADWTAGKMNIQEQKEISLDLGHNLSRVKLNIKGTDVVTVGLTLHENAGKTVVDSLHGFISYWEPYFGSEMGTAVVFKPADYVGYTKVESEEADASQLLVHLKAKQGVLEYAMGFAWKESGQYPTQAAWEAYLKEEASAFSHPLEIRIQ